jgi:aryl-alcohol dehydrogenase-like predicted oxidoreductase
MHTRTLGRTGLDCTEIGLGTWALAAQIYGDVPASDAHRTVRAALDAGINVFDTAPLYGDATRNGIAETRLGEALGADRDRVLVFSKFGRYSTDGAAPNFHAARARESVEGSLRRLGRDHLDLAFFHSPFGAHDIHDDVWAELDRLKTEGKIRFVGHSISMFQDTEGMARQWAEERRIDAVQVVYSLMNREAAALIADLAAQGVGIVARECLANGFLSGTITADTVFPEGTLNARYDRPEVAARAVYADALTALLVRGDVKTLPQAAFRWVLDDPGVTLALSGARNEAELADAIAAAHAAPYTTAERARATALHTRDFQAA